MSFSEIYSDRILAIAGEAEAPPRLPAPHGSARKVSRVCGSVVTVDIELAGGVVSAYGHEVNACALGQTSAAIMAANAVGSTPDELRGVRNEMVAMLKSGGEPPRGRWADLGFLQPVKDYPARHASTLLVFEAVVEALEKAGA